MQISPPPRYEDHHRCASRKSEWARNAHANEVSLQARPSCIRDDGHAVLVGNLYNLHYVLCRARVHYDAMCHTYTHPFVDLALGT